MNAAVARGNDDTAMSKSTMLIGEDTDLLVLVFSSIWSCLATSLLLYFRSDHASREKLKVVDLKKTKVVLGPMLCEVLPVIHTISSYDTTSRLFGISEAAKRRDDESLKSQARVFLTQSTKAPMTESGEHLVYALYGGDIHEGLDNLRYWKFAHCVQTNKTCVLIYTIPPISAAASFLMYNYS